MINTLSNQILFQQKSYSFLSITLSVILILSSCKNIKSKEEQPLNDGHKLIIEMVDAVGGRDRLYSLKDIEYTYSYQNLIKNKTDISTERYIFDGELSWGKYQQRDLYMPDKQGAVIQYFNGTNTLMSLNGELINDKEMINEADFMRKTNFYWLTMVYKLLDDGITYEKMSNQIVDGLDYYRVKISYSEGVGDAKDTYVLYINPKTKLVDQFLFSVMDYGIDTPFLMKVEHEEIEGLKLMTHRKYIKATWAGEVTGLEWTGDELSENLKFNNGFKPSDLSLELNL